MELAVAVGERDELVAGRPEPGAQRGAVAQVGRVVDGPDDAGMARPSARRRWPGSRSREPSLTMMISNVSAIVGRAASASSTRPAEVGLLVVGREEVRQPRRRGPLAATPAGPQGHGVMRRLAASHAVVR